MTRPVLSFVFLSSTFSFFFFLFLQFKVSNANRADDASSLLNTLGLECFISVTMTNAFLRNTAP